jgi:hypothetical protein
MPIENYSLNDIKTIFNAFGLPDKPYYVNEKPQRHAYYRIVPNASRIDLLEDTIEYVQEILHRQAIPTAERRVAFIFEGMGSCAVIACYQGFDFNKARDLIIRKGWNQQPPATLGGQAHRVLATAYARIELHCFIPPSRQAEIEPFLAVLSSRIRPFVILSPQYHPIFEHLQSYKGVSFTESIRQLLTEDTLSPFIMFVEALQKHKQQCSAQLVRWHTAQRNSTISKQIIDVLGILMKYHQVQKQREMLQRIPLLQTLLEEDAKWQQTFYALPVGHLQTLFETLPMNVLTLLLSLRDNPVEMLRQLNEQKKLQMQAVVQWEAERRQRLPQLSWCEWITQQFQAVPNYLWQRNATNSFKVMGDFIMRELVEDLQHYSSITKGIDCLLWIIFSLIAILVKCIPERYRFALQNMERLSDEEKAAQFGAGIGLILGFIYTYYSGIFELIFSYTLIFITETLHAQLTREYTSVSRAKFYSIKEYVPSVSTLLQITMIFLMGSITLYTNETYYFKRGLSAVALSEAARRFFRWLSRDDDLPADLQSSFEFMFSLGGSSLGAMLYDTYHAVQVKYTAQEHAIAKFTNLTREMDPSVKYVHGESLDFSFNPISLITGYIPIATEGAKIIQ